MSGPKSEPIAVVGMSCRLPGAGDPLEFWGLLCAGTDAVTEASEQRWPVSVLQEYRRGGFVDGVDRFDAAFFGVSPNEAAAMDPQQRLTLELAWQALEHARLRPSTLRGTATGVFVGAIAGDYALIADRLATAAATTDQVGPYTYTGTHRAIIANRVSYLLGLRGPSLTLDTGQSSALVAVQLACESLRRGESDVALAGGVNLNLLAETTAAIGRFGALSADGHCHVFDERANGYVRGEGGAVIVLKPLAAARRDGDVVHAVILGGAVNNDGGGDWLTAPDRQAQQEVIAAACRAAGVEPGEIGYAELHGTGTKVGDPVEAAALGAVLGKGRPVDAPLLVGSVKTNIGHLEGAAGIAGLLKVILGLANGEVPANVGFERPNPQIPLADLGLRVATERTPWPATATLAGVSSFGMGGTNCHLIVGPAPADTRIQSAAGESAGLPWLLSARTAPALSDAARRLGAALDAGTPAGGLGSALLQTRDLFEHRAVVSGEPEQRRAALADLAAGAVTGVVAHGGCGFVFPGQGSQWPGMVAALARQSDAFARRLAACAEALTPYVDHDPLAVLLAEPGAADLERVDVVQPALWAVMVSLAGLWQDHGVHPDVVIGHSQGEIAAATAIGALSMDDGARVVALRSRAIAAVSGSGGMLSIGAGVDAVEAALDGTDATVAAVNGPASVVVSGPLDALAKVRDHFEGAGTRTKLLPVNYASHSAAVAPVEAELATALEPVRPRSVPGVVFISTLTGAPIDTAELDAGYWYRSLRHQVRFEQAMRHALAEGCGLIVECSPHPALLGAVEQTAETAERDVTVIATLKRDRGGLPRFEEALAEAWVAGAEVDWVVPLTGSRRALPDLPAYPFQRKRFWLTDELSPVPDTAAGSVAPTTRRAAIELILTGVAAVCGHADAAGLQAGAAFRDLGVDSAGAVELRNRLKAATGLPLTTGVLFDYPSPDRLADHLLGFAGTTVAAAVEPALAAAGGDQDDPVVIVAAGCRYPGGVATPEDLWTLVAAGDEAIGAFPADRGWDLDTLFADGPDRSGTSDTRSGGFLTGADRFDAAFFGISPREAVAMDPQQRLMLEVSWEALERAGIDPQSLRGTDTGVFVGAMAPDYGPRLHQPDAGGEGHLLTGTLLSVVSGRLAYTLGLEGPALTVDTACSSSLVAIHLAAQALRRGDCRLALAGGVTVMSTPGMFVEFSRQAGLSADGRCKAFSADADGTGWAEGAGMVVLERRSDAERHGHPILAVLRGSAVNQDGRSNGMTAPRGPSQERVIRAALADARLDAADIDVVEAHGTGTTLGDPIEAQALVATYGSAHTAGSPLWLGSVKSNLGHTQAAAGVAGVIKMVEAMRHGVLPATLHVERPTPHVDWTSGVALLERPVTVTPTGDRPLRAAVSSFGISGTNAHLILEQHASPSRDEVSQGPLVWVVSARTAGALRAQAGRLHDYAVRTPDAALAATGWALAGRAGLDHRAVVVAADRDELLAALAALAAGTAHPALTSGTAGADPQTVFVFPGQGSQWAGMAVDLLDSREEFAAALRRCTEALRPYTGWSVEDVLRGVDGAPALAGSDVIQPVLFAVMISLAELWRAVGVEPAAVVGHSQGEITAACAAGALTLDAAAKVVALRSQALMRMTGTGGMFALSLPAAEASELAEPWAGRLWPAIFSGPASTVIAGDLDALDEFAAALPDGVQGRRVAIDYAAHTPHIETLRDELRDILADVVPHATDVQFCSALTGEFADPLDLTAEYWYRGLRHQVQFEKAVRAFKGFGTPVFVEASPHPVLIGHIRDALRDAGVPGHAVGSLRRGDGGWQRFLTAAASAWVYGAPVDWRRVLPAARPIADVPTYAFEHRRFWLEDTTRHPLVQQVVDLADGGRLLTGRLSLTAAPWLGDHTVGGTVLLPGTAYLDLALKAAAGAAAVEELVIEAPIVLAELGARQVQVALGAPGDDGRRTFTVHTRAGDAEDWTRHASGTLDEAVAPAEPLHSWPPAGAVPVEVGDAYERLTDLGYEYGTAFRGLTAAWRDGTDGYVEVSLPESVRADAGRFALHPALLDAALHLIVLDAAGAGDGSLLLPFAWTGVSLHAVGAGALRVRLSGLGGERISLQAWDLNGRPVLGADDLSLRRTPRTAAHQPVGNAEPGLYGVDWVPAGTAEPGTQRWAVVDIDGTADGLRGELRAAGLDAALYYDLPSLADATADAPPQTVVVAYTPAADPDDLAYGARESLYEALDLVQSWAIEGRFAGARLLFRTRGNLVEAPLWGLVRSAHTEHPGRFALLETDGDDVDWTAVAGALAAGEWQLRVRDGALQAPRLTPVAGGEVNEPSAAVPGCVLVTGGTTGVGALLARRLVDRHGVRHLVLASRRGAAAPGAADLVAELQTAGVTVDVAACDVSDRRAVAELLNAHPITGIVHAAGLVDDAPIDVLSPHHLDTVFPAKADAAWHLHELTADRPLERFVLCSSAAGQLGTAGQAAYAAANVFCDALAAHRHELGRPAASIAWGLWGDGTGMAGTLGDADVARLARAGLAAMDVEAALRLFDQVWADGKDALSIAARFDKAGMRAGAERGTLSPLLRDLAPVRPQRAAGGTETASPATSAAAAGPTELRSRLAGLPGPEALAQLVDDVRGQVALVLGHADTGAVDVDRAFSELGFDSLTAMELRNRLEAATGLRLAATVAFNYPTVTELSAFLGKSLVPDEPTPEEKLQAGVERVLAVAGADDLVAVLTAALARLGGPAGPPITTPSTDDVDDLHGASDDEIFAFIDNQF